MEKLTKEKLDELVKPLGLQSVEFKSIAPIGGKSVYSFEDIPPKSIVEQVMDERKGIHKEIGTEFMFTEETVMLMLTRAVELAKPEGVVEQHEKVESILSRFLWRTDETVEAVFLRLKAKLESTKPGRKEVGSENRRD